MKHIEFIKDLHLETTKDFQKDMEVKELFHGPFRRIVEIRMRNSATLSRHKADVPITVLCLSGTGIFRAGSELEEAQDLVTGTLLTLDAGVEHEVLAGPDVHILVTKFLAS